MAPDVKNMVSLEAAPLPVHGVYRGLLIYFIFLILKE
jgi:hypothetical protein